MLKKLDFEEFLRFVGEYIEALRRKLNFTRAFLCSHMRMSEGSYSKIKKGEEMKLNFYFRTLVFMIETGCVDRETRRGLYEEFMVGGMERIERGLDTSS